MRIGLKLAIWLVLFGVFSSALTGFYAYSKSRAILISASEDKLLTATQVLGQRFTDSLAPITNDLAVLAALPQARHLVAAQGNEAERAANRTMLEQTFASMLSGHSDYLKVRLIGAQEYGRELVRIDRSGNDIGVADAENLLEKGHFPYVFEALRLPPGAFYFSKINLNGDGINGRDVSVPTLRIATPVYGSQGPAAGIVIIDVNLNLMFNRIRSNIPRDIGVIMTNANGDYLIHPDGSKTFGFDRGRRYLIQNDAPEIMQILEQKKAALVLTNLRLKASDMPYAGAFVKVPFGAQDQNRFVTLGLITPLEAVLHDSAALGLTIVQITVLCSLAAICFSFTLSFVLTRRLNAMATAISQFEPGQPLPALPTGRSDEIGDLARSFVDMSDKLSAQVGELKDRQQHLNFLAHNDPLTQLPNRPMFLQLLEEAIERARHTGRSMFLMFIDLDQFKDVNDRFGHAVGDETLRLAARRMRATVRQGDTVARLSGDEFTVMIEGDSTPQDIERIGLQLIDAFSSPFSIEGHEFHLSCSIGIGRYPDDGGTGSQLLNNADAAMYMVKKNGRGNFRWYQQIASSAAPLDQAAGG
ncbi:diguanylate cyclase (GGDEF)-like protein [Actimicrobium sp. GrIS 1.19]|uniref:diguanylate cyclase domain-containing protein n=1 Tax=Actimicrobium sp. GrIS 1.19 TaxID=3071708 RepID=UPI002E0700DC|nr:diguanylate cyclase (GGDEF)-like protein [Actimicrobium sp. GrIS 1.19]